MSDSYRPTRPRLLATLREIYAFAARAVPAAPAGERATESSQPRGAVLVLPALLRGDEQTRGLRASLRRNGYAAYGWGLGADWGPTPRLTAGVEARLLQLSAEHGPVSLVGLSMGGLFCRWLGHRHPDHVRQVITVCSPFRAPLDSFWFPLRPFQRLWRVPDLKAMAAELERPLAVPCACVYSRRDGIVAWQSCYDPTRPQDCLAIEGYHVTIANDPAVRAIILQQLQRVAHTGSALQTAGPADRTATNPCAGPETGA